MKRAGLYALTAELVAHHRPSVPLLLGVGGRWPRLEGPRLDDGWEMPEAPEMPEEAPVVGVVQVVGPIAQRAHLEECTWVDGYDAIEDRLEDALTGPAESVVLVIDSPGGEAAGCFEAVRRMRGMVEQSGKRVVAYVDECATSAAYALALVADEIYAPDVATTHIGSIGCVLVHTEVSRMLDEAGVGVTVVRSGARKAEGLGVEPLSPDAKARLQAAVSECGADFAALVGELRGMDPRKVAALEGASFTAGRALELGLIDGLASKEEVFTMATKNPAAPAATAPAPVAAAELIHTPSLLEQLGAATVKLTGTADPHAAEALIASWKERADRAELLEQQAKAALEAAEQKERIALLDRGEREGRLTPAMRERLSDRPLASLRELLVGDKESGVEPLLAVLPAAATPREPTGAKSPANPGGPRGGLTQEERQVAKAMGLSDETEIVAARERLHKQDARMRGEVV